jgi:hypothetical protein
MTPPGGGANKPGILPAQRVITLTVGKKGKLRFPGEDLKINS